MTNHTPGPWELRPDAMGGLSPLIYPAGDHYPVASVTGYHISDGQRLPNAHLIAAAPELLEAAMAAIADVMSIDNDHSLAPEVGRKLRAAIAKAAAA